MYTLGRDVKIGLGAGEGGVRTLLEYLFVDRDCSLAYCRSGDVERWFDLRTMELRSSAGLFRDWVTGYGREGLVWPGQLDGQESLLRSGGLWTRASFLQCRSSRQPSGLETPAGKC